MGSLHGGLKFIVTVVVVGSMSSEGVRFVIREPGGKSRECSFEDDHRGKDTGGGSLGRQYAFNRQAAMIFNQICCELGQRGEGMLFWR